MFKESEKYFTPARRKMVRDAVAAAERQTSGEVRVCIEDHCPENILDHAANIFEETGMKDTALRNGVLIYVAYVQREFAIIGDAGIHAKVGENFWTEIKDTMRKAFQTESLEAGLSKGIEMCGGALAQYFPRAADDKNELPNEMIFGDGEKL